MKTRIPPLILLLIAGAIMWLVADSEFATLISIPYALALSLAWAALGILLSVIGVWQFRAAQTTSNPLNLEKTTSLVDTGVFSWSRNPMYVGMVLMSIGWGIWLGALANIVVIAVFVPAITELQIKPEEEALKKLFGSAFEEYCQRVRRWF